MSYRTPRQLLDAYRAGLPGAPHIEAETERCFAEGASTLFGELPTAEALRETGEGKRALLWRAREKFDPGAFGQEAQTTGDCTSHGDRNARDTSRSVEIVIAGEPEEYRARGATEPTYGARGHSGQGMSPAVAARFVNQVGWLARQNYPGVVDLSTYRASTGIGWGRGGVPAAVQKLCNEHKVGKYATPRTPAESRALLASGYAAHSGQNIGFSTKSDARGIAVVDGRWSHDMATVGYDDTREIYPECVWMIVNSWGRWNEKPRVWPEDVYGPWIPGMFLVPEDVYARYFIGGGDIYHYSEIEGFPARTIPDFGTAEWL